MFDYSQWIIRSQNRLANPLLPKTVTKLTTNDGGIVYLVGTAHFSKASEEDVINTINATQPDVVVVELCSSRSSIMELDETTLLREAQNINLSSIKHSMKQYGTVQGIVHILLLSISAQITKQLGMAPGGEFRVANKEARKIPGCLLVMGDRPINITLKRAISSLSAWNKFKFLCCLLFNKETINKEDVEKYKEKDMLEEFLESMAGEYPELRRVFVDERDAYLAHSLKQAVRPIIISTNPDTPNLPMIIPKVVVGIVGMGHTIGIEKQWANNIDIAPLMTIPVESSTKRKIKKIALISTILICVSYGGFKVAQRIL